MTKTQKVILTKPVTLLSFTLYDPEQEGTSKNLRNPKVHTFRTRLDDLLLGSGPRLSPVGSTSEGSGSLAG